jgi:hypothetical protein
MARILVFRRHNPRFCDGLDFLTIRQRRSIPPPMMACIAHALSMLKCEIHLIKEKAAKGRGGQ